MTTAIATRPKSTAIAITAPSEAFTLFLDTFGVFTEAARRVEDVDQSVQSEMLGVIEDHKADYVAALAGKQKAEEALKEWAKAHPEWFGGKKTLKCLHGTVSKRAVTSLHIPHEQLSIRLLEETGQHAFLRVTVELDLEALEKLTDEELAKLCITRVHSEIVTVKPITVDMGKAVVTGGDGNPKDATGAKEGK